MKMKKLFALFTILLFVAGINVAWARETISSYSVSDALSGREDILGDNVKFYFGDQAHPGVAKDFGEVRTNRKTNAFNKTDKEACDWVFLSAMIALRDAAVNRGANAVINIKSNYKNNQTSSNDSFRCGAGGIIAGVALKGKIVKLK